MHTDTLSSIFIGVEIKSSIKIWTQIWPGAWHYQTSNNILTNKQISNRSTWIDAALKSSLISSTSQFNLNFSCYENDPTANGTFCSSNFS
ncbi:unnamed protein product [Rotaria sp. Silwood1]|nr:unnamed protein product [Rotaria sp. Silwood1]CAF4577126.1 unnamed protein product [Rotaria sp. Silwood1]